MKNDESTFVSVKVSKAEIAVVDDAAQKAGVSRSDVLRALIRAVNEQRLTLVLTVKRGKAKRVQKVL